MLTATWSGDRDHLGVEVGQLEPDAPLLQLLEERLGPVVGLLLRRAGVGQAEPGPGQLDLVVEDEEVGDPEVGPAVLGVGGAGTEALGAWSPGSRSGPRSWARSRRCVSSEVAVESSRPLSSIDEVMAGRRGPDADVPGERTGGAGGARPASGPAARRSFPPQSVRAWMLPGNFPSFPAKEAACSACRASMPLVLGQGDGVERVLAELLVVAGAGQALDRVAGQRPWCSRRGRPASRRTWRWRGCSSSPRRRAHGGCRPGRWRSCPRRGAGHCRRPCRRSVQPERPTRPWPRAAPP